MLPGSPVTHVQIITNLLNPLHFFHALTFSQIHGAVPTWFQAVSNGEAKEG